MNKKDKSLKIEPDLTPSGLAAKIVTAAMTHVINKDHFQYSTTCQTCGLRCIIFVNQEFPYINAEVEVEIKENWEEDDYDIDVRRVEIAVSDTYSSYFNLYTFVKDDESDNGDFKCLIMTCTPGEEPVEIKVRHNIIKPVVAHIKAECTSMLLNNKHVFDVDYDPDEDIADITFDFLTQTRQL